MERIFTTLHVMGLLLFVSGIAYSVPIITSLIYDDGMLLDFVAATAIIMGFGGLMAFLTREYKRELKIRDGILLVSAFWTLAGVFATLPFIWGINLSFTDAYFEVMSGLTTTGATVIVGLDTIEPSLLIWRQSLIWYGGLGIIVFALAILPLIGVGGMELYKAEVVGPIKDEKLTPRIKETARKLLLAYFWITAACIISLKIAGMNLFDAISHTFATMGLGGFSTHDASIGFYNSVTIEIVLDIFMVLSGLNFATHYLVWRDRSLKPHWENPETKAVLILLFISSVFCAWVLILNGIYENYWTSLRYVTFNLISVALSCGFASTDFDYTKWGFFVPLWMLFISSICPSTGSTGGGIKMLRTLILFKQAYREIKKILHPNAEIPLKVGNMIISSRIAFAVLAFIFLYFMTVVIIFFILLLTGLDFITAFSATIATINNVGPGLGPIGPASTYQGFTDFQTWMCSLSMFLGRIEIFTFIVIFTPAFWQK